MGLGFRVSNAYTLHPKPRALDPKPQTLRSKPPTSSSKIQTLNLKFLIQNLNGGFRKIRGTFSGVPIKRTVIFWGLCWGPLTLGNYQIPKTRILGLQSHPPLACRVESGQSSHLAGKAPCATVLVIVKPTPQSALHLHKPPALAK